MKACQHILRTDPLPDGIKEQHLQIAPGDRVLRPEISSGQPARLGPDELPVLVAVGSVVISLPAVASASPRPSSISSRTALGWRLMPTPSGLRSGTDS